MAGRSFAELMCRVVEERAEPRLAVVLCHGYGAPADDLVPIGAELQRTNEGIGEHVRFYFPAAPIDLGPHGLPGGRAWWPINMAQLVEASESGRWEDVRKAMPGGMTDAREKLLACLEAIREETGLPWSRFVLGGFSQGAMLATDVALHLPETPAGLIVASGTLLNEEGWRERAATKQGLRVIQGHGDADPLLPFAGAVALRDLLQDSGQHVQFLPFRGGHTIATSLLVEVARQLAELVAEPEGI